MTQAPAKFNTETVVRIVDLPSHEARVAAIMALHAADPARQMADAEAALWREHDARHGTELSRLRADLADAVMVLEEHAILSGRAWVSQLEMLNLIRDLSALLSRLKDAKP